MHQVVRFGAVEYEIAVCSTVGIGKQVNGAGWGRKRCCGGIEIHLQSFKSAVSFNSQQFYWLFPKSMVFKRTALSEPDLVVVQGCRDRRHALFFCRAGLS